MGLWTWTHFYQIIPTFIIFAIISGVSAIFMNKCKKSIRYIPLQVIAVVLLILEVMKQIKSVDANGVYNLYSLPFHYCSLFLFLLPIHSFYHGKYSRFTDAAAFGCLASLMLDMLLMPAVIYGEGNILNYPKFFGNYDYFMDFHTVTFHNLVVLYFMLTIAYKLYEFNTKRDMAVMGVFLAVYVVIAATLSYTLKVNFHNLYQCNIEFVEEFRQSVIQATGIFGIILYVCIMFVLTIVFAYASYFLAKLVIKIINKLIGLFTKKKAVA